MISFDATSRELCTPRRILTNTPLQALVTLNDTVYLDLARHFARRLDSLARGDPKRQIEAGYRAMLYKEIAPAKLEILLKLYQESLDRFTRQPVAGRKLLGFSGSGGGDGGNVAGAIGTESGSGSKGDGGGGGGNGGRLADKASLVVVCNALLNLDEVITKN
jgi:hypothetical protein